MSTNNELEAFDSLYDRMRSSLTTADVIGGCFSYHIISNSERDEVQAAGTAGGKAAALLDAVRRSIVIDPANFNKFLDTLSNESKYTPLVKQLREFLYYYKCCKQLAPFEKRRRQSPETAERRAEAPRTRLVCHGVHRPWRHLDARCNFACFFFSYRPLMVYTDV